MKKMNKSAEAVAGKMKKDVDNGKSSRQPDMKKTMEGSKQGRRTGGNK